MNYIKTESEVRICPDCDTAQADKICTHCEAHNVRVQTRNLECVQYEGAEARRVEWDIDKMKEEK